jgi:hypothetical protein
MATNLSSVSHQERVNMYKYIDKSQLIDLLIQAQDKIEILTKKAEADSWRGECCNGERPHKFLVDGE